MAKLSQHEKILKYLKLFGSITPIQAFEELRITKLSTRIGEMKRAGININTEIVRTTVNGERVTYARYSLDKEDSNG